MKKVTLILTVFVFTLAFNASAQLSAGKPKPTPIRYELENVMVSSMKEGSNSVPVPNGRGTLNLQKRGEKIVAVVYTDASGKSIRLTPQQPGTGGAPKPECKFPLPDACFGNPVENIGLCICRPTNLSNGDGGDPTAILIALLVPAVQKIREAAHK